jgi:hypothetical protein
MEFIEANRQVLAWILLWAWIAITLFIFNYKGRKSVKLYVVDLALLVGSLYLFFGASVK